MQMFVDTQAVYLHREPVDFRKAINGLAEIVEQTMSLSPFSGAVFVFCNGGRDKLKVLYWDKSGFCLWHKRLEEERFKWPRTWADKIITLSEAQWHWLLSGYDITRMQGHRHLAYKSLG